MPGGFLLGGSLGRGYSILRGRREPGQPPPISSRQLLQMRTAKLAGGRNNGLFRAHLEVQAQLLGDLHLMFPKVSLCRFATVKMIDERVQDITGWYISDEIHWPRKNPH
jgi:hypothetical protein